MINQKEIMAHYIVDPQDSYFVHGTPPIETVEVVAYNLSWPKIYAKVALSIENELGSSVLKIDHIGSTAIPGIAAKPVIDIDLTVADPADEESYVSALENLGFQLIVREPRFHEHRLFHLAKPRVNLHVFGPDCPETIRHLLFRDWLRQSEEDCQIYANAKLEAVEGCNVDIEKYHENKKNVVHEIYRRIFQYLGYFDSENV
ncbi:hypothetical protein JHS3_19800 [Jeongeupia sp. HS-3]|uniref:GrpB family protein n=1 Tax=Jeongeupia sp. HS-3 TaxID=1009682 RepID=UPI0018A557BD|nr:GrpB family protein [Jeongeupia sp. HS-3]BCL76244.1 hypothetical protein JHS3_19800 [Jeongeupia sp. HS-3]